MLYEQCPESRYHRLQVNWVISNLQNEMYNCCICCGPDEERILDVVPREDGARNSG